MAEPIGPPGWPAGFTTDDLPDDAELRIRARGQYTSSVCDLAWLLTDPTRRGTLRVLVNEPPAPERGAAQDLEAIVTSPLPAPFCESNPWA